MSVVAKYKHNQQLTTGTLTGSAPQTGAGAALQMPTVAEGTLSASISVTATVNTLTLTGKWQASSDGITYVDCFPSNNAAQVTIVTGSGSAVSSTRRVDAPSSVYGERYARYVVVSGAASALGADSETYSIAYNYRPVSIITA
jgi:hypothetical protein